MSIRSKFIEVYALGNLRVTREEILTLEGTWERVCYRVTGRKSKTESWNKTFPGTPEGRLEAIRFVQDHQD